MRFWVGGYTADGEGSAEGIGVLHAGAPDSALAGGDLAFAGVAARTDSPSWVAAHPTLDVLYVAQEAAGTVQAFTRTGEETFAPLGGAVDAGDSVCHVAVAPSGDAVIASCYGDGRVMRFALDARGALGAPRIADGAEDPYSDAARQARAADVASLADLSSLAGMVGAAAIGDLPLFGADAQAAASAQASDAATEIATEEPTRVSRSHQSCFLPGGVIATTDLGFDLVRFWTVRGGDLHETQRVTLPRGCGPRHTVWHPSGHLYVVTELSLEVFVLAPEPGSRPGEGWRVISASPLAGEASPGSDFAAEIALTRDAEYALVGIRGSNTIASLRVRDGGAAVVPVALADSGVDWPRHHVVERDTVLVAGQLSNEVAALSLDERTGAVGRVRRRVEVPSPTCLVAAP
ncbi:beta-propeller fold lactonase family protein [Microbacterium lacticum]|uniref:lactonase family protein n=1 Tax=Microbacterium lacticum TaxID=33885 RepID=UPI0028D07208|nr:beta-propeller fold lactonase family protein [Microbacterium lacticum]